MSVSTLRFVALVFVTVFSLAACGGGGGSGGDSSGSTPPPVADDPAEVTVVGPISEFGSVVVNGIRFESSNAEIVVNGEPATEADLRLGQMVTVSGHVNSDGTTGSASRIEFTADVLGPVEDIDLADARVMVMGQAVLINEATVFDDGIDPETLRGIDVGDVVEVSGFINARGEVEATRIDLPTSLEEFRVSGRISDLDMGNFRFRINDLLIDFSIVVVIELPDGAPIEGIFVQVMGTITEDGVLVITSIEIRFDDMPGEEGDRVELLGFITRFESPEDFDVGFRPVTIDDETQFENGTAEDLALGRKVLVDGVLNADLVLVADTIRFIDPAAEPEGRVEIEALVDDIDLDAATITLLGIPVAVDDFTLFNDDLEERRPFGLGDISVGDYVEMQGREDPPASRMVQALRIERKPARDEVQLEGTVESVDQSSLTILGITVLADSDTEYFAADRTPITADEFFGLASGTRVDAFGGWDGMVITATRLELN